MRIASIHLNISFHQWSLGRKQWQKWVYNPSMKNKSNCCVTYTKERNLRRSRFPIRVIGRVRKTQAKNPEFGHTQGEILKKPAKKYLSIQRGMKLRKPSILVVNWVSSCLFFFLRASTGATYIFTASNCPTTIISLEPRALNAEFQHSMLRFNKMCLLCG